MILTTWPVVSVLTAALCRLLVRAGQLADSVDRVAFASFVAAAQRSEPSARRPMEGMAEFSG